MLGHPHYEFVAPGFIARDEPGLLRAMLLAYGFSEDELDASLAQRLMAYTLLHRFGKISEYLGLFGSEPPADLAELQRRLWTFRASAELGEPGA